jgi:hypothetical protein
MGRNEEMEIKLFIFLFIIGFTAYCSQVEEEPVVAPKTTIEIGPGESAQIIIVEPKEEAIERTLKWDWKTREYLRRKTKEDAE